MPGQCVGRNEAFSIRYRQLKVNERHFQSSFHDAEAFFVREGAVRFGAGAGDLLRSHLLSTDLDCSGDSVSFILP